MRDWSLTVPTTAFRLFLPGTRVRCWCGSGIEHLGPHTYARVMAQPDGTSSIPAGVHRTIRCRSCGTILQTVYSTGP